MNFSKWKPIYYQPRTKYYGAISFQCRFLRFSCGLLWTLGIMGTVESLWNSNFRMIQHAYIFPVIELWNFEGFLKFLYVPDFWDYWGVSMLPKILILHMLHMIFLVLKLKDFKELRNFCLHSLLPFSDYWGCSMSAAIAPGSRIIGISGLLVIRFGITRLSRG